MPRVNKEIILNDNELYEELLENRGVDSIEQYSAYNFNKGFKDEDFSYREHVWSHGDRLIKLSQQYYGNSEYWWVIGLFNGKPTDAHMEMGDIIKIPFPILSVYRSMV